MTRKKILLVDDSETILQMEQMILQQDCYEVVGAKSFLQKPIQKDGMQETLRNVCQDIGVEL